MHKNNIPLKVALGYCIIAIIMILAISLVYSNTKSIIAINEASREYIKKKDAADSTMTSLLKEEQKNLKQLSDAMAGKSAPNYLHDKVKSLNTGKDSIVVHSKAPQTHEAKKTTVEVMTMALTPITTVEIRVRTRVLTLKLIQIHLNLRLLKMARTLFHQQVSLIHFG